jgi:hypothetical protein
MAWALWEASKKLKKKEDAPKPKEPGPDDNPHPPGSMAF